MVVLVAAPVSAGEQEVAEEELEVVEVVPAAGADHHLEAAADPAAVAPELHPAEVVVLAAAEP